jgi:alanine racemase
VGYGARWVAEKPARIATVSIGYGDGYPRHAPNGTPVLVKGKRAPLAGTVSMDMITVDITGREDVRVGDPVELWGPSLPVNDIAACAGTIGYELLAGMTARLPRVFRPGA